MIYVIMTCVLFIYKARLIADFLLTLRYTLNYLVKIGLPSFYGGVVYYKTVSLTLFLLWEWLNMPDHPFDRIII